MADGKIYITISDKRTGEGLPTTEPETTKKEKKDESFVKKYSVSRITEQIAMKALNTTISNIGFFTGDYQAQRDMQSLMSIGSSLVGIGVSFAVNPILGLINTGLKAIDAGISAVKNDITVNRQNRQIELLRQRTGMDTLTNGSRSGN